MIRLLKVCCLVLIVLGLLGCGALPQPMDRSSSDHHIVQIGPSGQAGSALSHPYRIEADRLAAHLAALRYEETGRLLSAGRLPVFDADEVAALAPRLAESLAVARPDQRVDFVSFGGSGGGIGIGNSRKTEGTLFVDAQGQLNIAFAGIRQLMTVDDDYTRFRDFSLGDPLTADRSLVRLATDSSSFSVRRQRDGSAWPMWVSLRPDAPMPVAERGSSTAAPSASVSAPPPPLATGSTAPPADPQAAPLIPQDLPATQAAIRERLAFLKGLYDDGLISEADYQRERERVLRQLP